MDVHDLLLTHPSHQEELEPQPLFRITGREQSFQFGLLVDLRFFPRVAWPVIFANQPTNLLSLQERHYIFAFVMNAARGLLLFIAQERSELQHVTSFDAFHVELRAGFREVTQSGFVCGVCIRLLTQFRTFQEVCDATDSGFRPSLELSCRIRPDSDDGGAVAQPGLSGHVFGEIDFDFSQRLPPLV